MCASACVKCGSNKDACFIKRNLPSLQVNDIAGPSSAHTSTWFVRMWFRQECSAYLSGGRVKESSDGEPSLEASLETRGRDKSMTDHSLPP